MAIRRIAVGIDGSPQSAGAHHASCPPPVPGVVIRSVRPDDATRLRALHARLSDDGAVLRGPATNCSGGTVQSGRPEDAAHGPQ
jgi:hypothetical protein